MEIKISNSRKYIIWLVKIVFLLALLLGGGKAQAFWQSGTSLLLSYQNIFFYFLMGAALCFGVWKFESLYQTFRCSEKKRGLWHAVYFAVSFTLFYNPLDKELSRITDFKRMIGPGTIADVDVSSKISNFHSWFFFFAASFLLFFLLANDFMQKKRDEESRRIAQFFDHFIVLANVHLMFRCILFFDDMENGASILNYSTNLIMLVVFAMAAYFFLHLEKNISAQGYAQLLMAGFCASIPAAALVSVGWHGGKLLVGIQTMACFACICLVKMGKNLFLQQRGKALTAGIAIVFSMIPFGTSFYIELVNILNQYGVFVVDLRRYYGIMILLTVISAVIFTALAERKSWALKWWKKWTYPAVLFGLSCLSAQIPLESVQSAEIFETANSSILISDFLQFGSIPLVEHYGGHMMTSVWEGILYGILNQDVAGAILSPYACYFQTVLVLLFFYMAKYVWDENAAFFTALLFPFLGNLNYFGLGILVCLAVIAYVKKNTYPRAALVWLSFIWCALYRLDIGVAFGAACVFALAVYIIVYRNWSMIKQLGLTLAAWVFAGVAVGFGICLAKGISPTGRLREFLMMSLSNQTWSHSSVGDTSQAAFAFSYMFLPLAVGICLIVTVYSEKIREQDGVERWMLLLLLGASYFGNFSRGLVRHSLVEGFGGIYFVVTWSAYVFLAIFFSCFKNNRKLFLPVFAGLMVCNSLFCQDGNFREGTVADGAAVKTGEFTDAWFIPTWEEGESQDTAPKTYWKRIQEKGEAATRIQLENGLQEMIFPYRIVIDALLEEDETFVDFTNQTFLYSAIGRKNPVYVSQSPMQLSGEYTQEQFVKEMEGVPLVLMALEGGCHLDNINNEYRYYKVAEYIYQNYVPLCKYGNAFAVWCLPNQYEEMAQKVKTRLEAPYEMADYGYDAGKMVKDESGNVVVSYQGFPHKYVISRLAELWAKADHKKASENPVAAELTDNGGVYVFDRKGFVPGKEGNYLLVEASYDGADPELPDELIEAVVKAGIYENGEFVEKFQYSFALKEGKNQYLFRVSSDYYWYCEEINGFSLKADGEAYDVSMKILDGD